MNKKAILGAVVLGLTVGSVAFAGAGKMHKADAKKAETEKMGECHGVNACKGTGACGGKSHSCAGKNECKGKGWVEASEKNCAQKKGKFKG